MAGQQRMMPAQARRELRWPAERLGQPYRDVIDVGWGEVDEHRRQQRVRQHALVERAAEPAKPLDTVNVFIQRTHDYIVTLLGGQIPGACRQILRRVVE